VFVIPDIDDTLKALLVQKVPIDTSAIDVTHDMPGPDWSKKLSRPTINLYLYDIRENVELKSNEPYLTRGVGNSGSLRRAPVRIDLTYLITAWTTEIADEHLLLGQILTTLPRFPTLPEDVLQGSLRDQPLPLLAWIARPEHTRNAFDLWGHLEHRMKTSLSYVITASVQPYAAEQVTLVTKPPIATVAEKRS
jgi:hypothetical protein